MQISTVISRNVFYLLKSFVLSIEEKIKTSWHAVGTVWTWNWAHHNPIF